MQMLSRISPNLTGIGVMAANKETGLEEAVRKCFNDPLSKTRDLHSLKGMVRAEMIGRDSQTLR